jgi:hypothetical protein
MDLSKKYDKYLRDNLDLVYNLNEKYKKLVKALTPSKDTKFWYSGEFSFNIEEDEEIRCVTVPWTTIKEIMKTILEKGN